MQELLLSTARHHSTAQHSTAQHTPSACTQPAPLPCRRLCLPLPKQTMDGVRERVAQGCRSWFRHRQAWEEGAAPSLTAANTLLNTAIQTMCDTVLFAVKETCCHFGTCRYLTDGALHGIGEGSVEDTTNALFLKSFKLSLTLRQSVDAMVRILGVQTSLGCTHVTHSTHPHVHKFIHHPPCTH